MERAARWDIIPTMAKVLVTGGAGFIGSELTRQLLARGGDVTVFDDFSVGTRANLWKGVRAIRGDLRSPRDLKKIQSTRFDAVYHLAALHFIPACNRDPEGTLDVNVVGTQKLLHALAARPPRALFFASTAAVYPPTSVRHRETGPLAPMDIYGVTKLMGEHLVHLFAAEHATKCVIGRLFNAYGPRETNPHLIPALVAQVEGGAKVLKVGNRTPYRDYMHTGDMARAILALVRGARARAPVTANIGSGKEYSVDQVIQAVLRAHGGTIRVVADPKLKRKVERKHLRPDLSKLRALVGKLPSTPFAEGVAQLIGANPASRAIRR